MSEELELKAEELYKIMKDPVRWAKHHLTSAPRWYQEQILRHPHNRKVLRCGRRIGKCIEENQRIVLESGAYVKVKDLYKNQSKEKVFGLGSKPLIEKSEIYSIEDNGIRPVYEITTRKGNQIVLTENHPLLTVDGWEEVQNLSIGDYVATPRKIEVFGDNDSRSENFIKLLAYFTTSCKSSDRTLTIELKSPEMIMEVARICSEEGLELVQKTQKLFYIIDRTRSNEIIELFREYDGTVPDEVFLYTRKKLGIFLTAIYDSQGWLYSGETPEIGYGGRNKEFLLEISHLLLRFGIKTAMVKRMVNNAPYLQMMIYKCSDIITFGNEILHNEVKDYSEVIKIALSKEDRPMLIPRGKYFDDEVIAQNMKIRKSNARTIQKDRMLFLAKKYSSKLFEEVATSDIFYDQIISIEYVGDRQTYDVFVPQTQNLIVEDFFVHNTWTMVAHILWVAFTSNGGTKPHGATCVVATPYDTQARLIFDELVKNIENSEILSQSLESKTKNPYYIKFKNGSEIKLFTAGTKSGSEGGSLRGQKADWLYMDKYLSLYMVTCIE